MNQSVKITIGRFLPDSIIVFLGELETQAQELNRATPAERKMSGCNPLKFFELREKALTEKADVRFKALNAIRDAAARLVASLDAEISRRKAEQETRDRAKKVRAA